MPTGSILFLSGAALSGDGTLLGGAANSTLPLGGFTTPDPPRSGNTTPDPWTPSGNTTPDPWRRAFTTPDPPNAPRMPPQPTAAPRPRRAVDPAWVYGSPSSLLAQALRRSGTRIVRNADRALRPEQEDVAVREGQRVLESNLWRWAPEFRAKTVAGELLTRVQAHGLSVFLMPVLGQARAGAPRPVFTLPQNSQQLWQQINLDDQVDKVIRAATEREDRLPEILSQQAEFWPFFESLTGLPLTRAPRTSELLAATHDWAVHVLMQLKHGFAGLRPVQKSSLVLPVITTPGHGTLPSGHATLAAFTSELLYLLLYRHQFPRQFLDRSDELDRLARRIAFNRVVAGVHYPVDGAVGYRLGTQLARIVSALAGNTADMPAAITAAQSLAAPYELVETPKQQGDGRPPLVPGPRPAAGAPMLAALWEQVTLELDDLRV